MSAPKPVYFLKKMSHNVTTGNSDLQWTLASTKQFTDYQFQISIYLDLKLCLYLNNDIIQTIVT